MSTAAILKVIQDHADKYQTDEFVSYTFRTSIFYIDIKGGLEESDPPEVLEDLLSYKSLSIKIWEYHDMPDPEKLIVPPLEFEIDGQPRIMTFDVACFPHYPFDISNDIRFKDQEWAKEFKQTYHGYKAIVSLDTLCQIIKYCYKVESLKVFL